MQSLWNPNLAPGASIECPIRLADLFDPPYQNAAVRVHSNSWNTQYRIRDAQGNPIAFRQVGYSDGANDIDEFVYNHSDMVICFAAGNRGDQILSRASVEGHIGAEAA